MLRIPFVLSSSLVLLACQDKKVAGPPPPVEVEVVSVTQRDVPIYGEWIATLDGYVNADIRPQVSGYVVSQAYKEGSFVRKGGILFRRLGVGAPGGLRTLQHGGELSGHAVLPSDCLRL